MQAARSAPPLSHHDILAQAAPFAQLGLRVDLAACDRARRRIVFTAQPAADHPQLVVHFELYLLPPDPPVLIRFARLNNWLQATLTAKGSDVAQLLRAFASVPPTTQFDTTGDVPVAFSFDIEPDLHARPTLTSCAARVRGLLIETDARTVIGEPMTTTLKMNAGHTRYAIPDDLLALTHSSWRPLVETDEGWSTQLRLPVREPGRSREAVTRFTKMVGDVAQALAGSPGDYHRARQARRMRLYLRRFTPIIACVLIIASLPLIDRFLLDAPGGLHPGFLSLPPLLMIGAMALTWRDTPRFEIPPRPRPLAHDAWPAEDSDNASASLNES